MDVTYDELIDFDLETYPLEIKTDSDAGSGDDIGVLFYTAEEGIEDNYYDRGFEVWFYNPPLYQIYSCTSEGQYFTTTPSLTLEDTWTITKTDTGLTFELNGDEVLNYLFSSSSYSDYCVDAYNVEVTRIMFDSDWDTASDQYRAGTPGQSQLTIT